MKRTSIFTALLLSFTFIYGQNNKNLSIEIINGISLPNSDFSNLVQNGFNNEISINKSFCDKLSLGMGVKHSSFNVKQEFGPTQGTRNQIRSIGFDIGPQASFNMGKFSIKLYGRSGISVNSTPEVYQYYANSDIITYKLKQQSLNALMARVGAKINTELCRGIQLFVSSEYQSSLNGNLNFYTKDISKAINAEGSIDPDLANEIPNRANSLKFSSINVNFGVSFVIGKMGNHPNRKSSNPLHQENTNNGSNVLYEGVNISNDNWNGSSDNKAYQATDYNSSRSNKQGIIANEDINMQNNGSRASQATDYNSSRSNKQGIIANEDINMQNNGSRASQATDYNSSRSNKQGIIANEDINMQNNGSRASQATDYNSSRSNKQGIIAIEDNNMQNNGSRASQATDYNSSRSNKQGIIANEDISNQNNGSRASQATDYNSSRSNKADTAKDTSGEEIGNEKIRTQDNKTRKSNITPAVGTTNDIRESMQAADKRKIKRKLKREERKRKKKENKKRKVQAKSVY
nr:hypothetical protein [uncultured Marinifilum sp.]